MKNIINIGCLLLLMISVSFVSCKDDDDCGSAPISVSNIYLENYKDTVNQDRTVDFARLGQMIRIEGSGFCGLQNVYINGYDTYFNTTYVTDRSMLITVSNSTPVIGANENERNTIRFVKTGTEYVYSFVIRDAAPSVSSVSNTIPMVGETVTVYGSGLHETTKVTLPGNIEITDVTSDEDGEWYSFVMPDGITEGGALISEGANGKVSTPGYFNFTSCMVLDFDGNGTQGFWSWKEEGSMINDEDLVDDPLATGRGKCVQMIPDRILNNADGGIVAKKTRATECWTAGTGNEMDDWTRMYPYIPAETPVTDVALQFDAYVPDAWSVCGCLEIVLFNNFNFAGVGSDDDGQYTAFLVPYIQNGAVVPYSTTEWTTVTIPFSKFGYYADQIADGETLTFEHVVDTRNKATYKNLGMGIVNNNFTYQGVTVTSTLLNQKIYLDNWRIVPCKNVSLSDFED